MGNTSSINTARTDNVKDANNTETINWNNVKTEDMGVNHIAPAKQLSVDIKELISKLQAGTSESDENFSEDILEGALKNKKSIAQKNNTELSETSPFITSDVYNYLNNTDASSVNIKQGGGASKKSKRSKKSKKQLKGSFEDSSTSETSSASSTYKLSSSTNVDSSSTGGSVKKTEKKVSRKASRKGSKKKAHRGSNASENDSSYLSSSAHTDHNFSDSNNASVTNENMNHSAISINTSDINMVSEY